jgi:hypothetical protein
MLFFVVSFLIVITWPDGGDLRQALLEARDFSRVPTAMWFAFLLMYVPIGLLAGWVTVSITENKIHP